MGTQNYARLRFGIGNDFPRGGQIDYVLGHFTDEDWKTMEERLERQVRLLKVSVLPELISNKNNGL